LTEANPASTAPPRIPQRAIVVGLAFLAVFVCYVDRVNISVAIIPMAAELGWSPQTQGTVLSSFFAGYLLLQIAGGRLADRFGGKVVLGAGVLLWSLFTVLTPPAAFLGFGALLAARIAMGMGEAVTFPSIYSLYGRWVPQSERSRAVGLMNSGIPLGTIFALVGTPWIVERFGWEWAFYAFGALGVVWFAGWQWGATSDPARHPRVTPAELATIRGGGEETAQGPAPPLRLTVFLGRASVWAIVVAHFCNNWSLYVLLSWLPTFVTQGLGVDYSAVGWFTMAPHVTLFLFLNVAGRLADALIERGMPVGRVRKLLNTVGFGGLAAALLVVGHVESAVAAIAVMSAGTAVGALVTGGFAVNHMDVAPRHAGTLMGITNTAGTLPGVVGVYASGLILEWTGSWALVFQVAAGVVLFGMVFFLLFASGERELD